MTLSPEWKQIYPKMRKLNGNDEMTDYWQIWTFHVRRHIGFWMWTASNKERIETLRTHGTTCFSSHSCWTFIITIFVLLSYQLLYRPLKARATQDASLDTLTHSQKQHTRIGTYIWTPRPCAIECRQCVQLHTSRAVNSNNDPSRFLLPRGCYCHSVPLRLLTFFPGTLVIWPRNFVAN